MARKGKNKKKQPISLKLLNQLSTGSFEEVIEKQNMIAFGSKRKEKPNRRNPFQYGKGLKQ